MLPFWDTMYITETKTVSYHEGYELPSNTEFLWPTYPPHSRPISIPSAVFAGFAACNQHTDKQTNRVITRA